MAAKPAVKKSKSILKRVRQSAAKTEHNRSAKSMLKTLVKKAEKDIAEKSKDAEDALKKAVSAIDKAVRKGIIHKNTASRKVSRLTKLVNSTPPSEAT